MDSENLKTNGERCCFRIGMIISDINYYMKNGVSFQLIYPKIQEGREIISTYDETDTDMANTLLNGIEARLVEMYASKL